MDIEINKIIANFYLTQTIIQLAIDMSINTKILKENLKVLVEIKELLKNEDKNL